MTLLDKDKYIVDISLDDIMSNSFGRYAKYIIQDRALPDIRDGLKPVQRRILYAMLQLGLTPSKPYKKSARTVGEVIGKYHPHGDSAVYEAMVRMSQDWKNNICLVQMHGNNGSIDGDSAAAMRYTESRLSEYSLEMMNNIEKNTVKFIPNFDDSEKEPSVFPTLLPNILINGSTGIAAGYATNIPPYNLKEVCNFLIAFIDNKEMKIKNIMELLPGPDFPTGAIVHGKDEIKSIYESGKGRLTIRSKYEQSDLNDKTTLIRFTEIPYDVNKSNLLKTIDEIRINNKIPGIKDVRDESDKNGISICIEVDKTKNVDAIKAYLFKNTQLQVYYNANIVVIKDKKPIQASIYDIANAYVDWANEILVKSAEFDLRKYESRKEIVEGLIVALSQIDQVIKVIRSANSKEEAFNNVKNLLKVTDKQADAIISLKLYNLTNFDVFKLQEELEELSLKIIETKLIIENEKHRAGIIKQILMNYAEKFGIPRKSSIEENIEVLEFSANDVIDVAQYTMVVTKNGYIKYVTDFISRNSELLGMKYKEDDVPIFYSSALSTLEHLFVLTSRGRCIIIPAHKIKTTFARMSVGVHINDYVTLDIDEKIIFCFNANIASLQKYKLLIATKNGFIKQMYTSCFGVFQNVKSQTYIKLKDNDEVVDCCFVLDEDDQVCVFTKNGLSIKYDLKEVPILNRSASGVKSIKLKDNESVISTFCMSIEIEKILIFTDRGIGKIDEISIIKRPRYSSGKPVFVQGLISQSIKKCYPLDPNYYFNASLDNNGVYTLHQVEDSDVQTLTLKSEIKPMIRLQNVAKVNDFKKQNFENNDAILNSRSEENEDK